MMREFQHSGRLSLIDAEMSWRLTDDGLTATSGQRSKTIPYESISGLRIISFAGAGGGQARAILTTHGYGKHKIGSHHYVSLGNFEDRSSSYVPLVCELASRVADANAKARFVTGSLGLWIAWMVVCLLVLGLVVLVAAAALEAAPDWLRLVSAVLFVALIGPFSLKWAARSLPQSFDPKSIRAEMFS